MQTLRRAFIAFISGIALTLSACGPGDPATTADTAPVITTQPASATSTGDTPTTFKVVATGGALTYQWFKDGTAISGATSATYATSTAGSYDVVVSNTLGQVRSTAAVLTISTDPVITVQPVSASVTTGRSARFSVVATGVSLTYQWLRAGVAIGGATGNSFTATAADTYSVVVSSSRAGAKPVTSDAVTLTVSATAIAPAITKQPVAVTVTAGQPASFSVGASGTDLTYAWFKDNVAITSATSALYTIDAVATVNAGNYYVVVKNDLGFVSSVQVSLTVLAVGGGSNTAAVVATAQAFMDTLSSTQKSSALSALSSDTVLFSSTIENARTWASTPGGRHGLRLNSQTLNATQLAAAEKLIGTALSASGATLMSEIRLADDVYAVRNADTTAGSAQYSIAFIGAPSNTTPWMLQLTGHQLAYNVTYNAGQVGATPTFLGTQPPNWAVNSAGVSAVNNTATSTGTPHAPMESQRKAVAALASALQGDAAAAAAAKLATATIDLRMAPSASTDTAFKSIAYPTGTTGRGVLYANLNASQQAAVKEVVQAWVKTQAADVAQTLLDAYLADASLTTTYVAYGVGAGGSADFGEYPNANALPASAAGSYLRIDGPRVWIEFLVKADDANAGTSGTVHYRSVWRDKVADYGARF